MDGRSFLGRFNLKAPWSRASGDGESGNQPSPGQKIVTGVNMEWPYGTGHDCSFPDSDLALQGISQFEADCGKQAAIIAYGRDWGPRKGKIDPALLDAIDKRGSIALVDWRPRDTRYQDSDPRQSPYYLPAIAAGSQDDYIQGVARDCASHGKPILLKFMEEFNGKHPSGPWWPLWSPGGQTADGGTVNPQAYVNAWRHVHDIFRAEAALNVLWVWAPATWSPNHNPWHMDGPTWDPTDQSNKAPDGSTNADAYPGDDYVDYLALQGYNWGNARNPGAARWKWFRDVFDQSIQALSKQWSQPILITETSSDDQQAFPPGTPTKADWLTDSLGPRGMPAYPRLAGFVIFNWSGNPDVYGERPNHWTVESNGGQHLSALREGLASDSFSGVWPAKQ